VRAGWALLGDGTAVIEMAAASGFVLLKPSEFDPLRATTFGTGELIVAALERGCAHIIVGVGGSATVDAGSGAMRALGAKLVDADGDELEGGGAALARLSRIDLTARHPKLVGAEITVASDVTNTLCGEAGAAHVFGPQKGASVDDVRTLDQALSHFADVALRDLGIDLRAMPGSGAAGGLGAGLVIVAGAKIEPGFDIVAEAVGLADRVAAADVVITGEGRLDGQTAYGKTAAGVARIARAHGRRVGAVAGSVRADFDRGGGLFDVTESASPEGMPAEEAMAKAQELVGAAASRVAMLFGVS
jgi:glycerate kinase